MIDQWTIEEAVMIIQSIEPWGVMSREQKEGFELAKDKIIEVLTGKASEALEEYEGWITEGVQWMEDQDEIKWEDL